jgi:HupE/UreJ protein
VLFITTNVLCLNEQGRRDFDFRRHLRRAAQLFPSLGTARASEKFQKKASVKKMDGAGRRSQFRCVIPLPSFCVGASQRFANVLAELGLPAGALTVALVSFNLGVEAGHLVIVSAILPLAYLCRHWWFYPRIVLGAGSCGIVAIASVWLIERSLNLRFFT